MPPKQWKSTCMDSPLVTASMDCFQSWPQTIFHCSKQEATKSGIRSSQWCGGFNVVSSKWHLMWKTFSCRKYRAQSFGAPRISISSAHMVTTTVTFTDRVLKMSSKLHAALMLPSNTDARSVGLQDHGSVQRPLLYGIEIVRVLTGNAVQVIPTFFVGVSPPDIFFSRRSPLASAGGHGSNCDLTDVPYLEHDASHLTDSSLHSEPCERQQCKRNARTKLPPVATKCRCTTTSHCFNLQVQHATMPSTTGALRSSCLLTSKWDTELQAETRCHDAVEPLPFPALLHGMRDKSCHTDTK